MWMIILYIPCRELLYLLKFKFHKQMLMRIFRVLVLTLFFVSFSSHTALSAGSESCSDEFDWTPIMEAIIQVESGGNESAKCGNQVGAMQITPILVAECNSILKARGQKKRYKLSDRLSLKKSKEMFLLVQSKYNPRNDIEKAIRSWNGGVNYSVKHTQRYFNKVMKLIG